MWCIGKITEEYRERMYDLLELYAKPYNPLEPVVNIDEKSKQLISDTRPCLRGKIRKTDYEYIRKGTRNIFVAVEPKAGKRIVQVTKTRKKADFANFIRILVDEVYPEAVVIHFVLDNLNTHFAKSFYATFDKEEAERILSRIQFHYTPKHASWLNMAEIEIGIMDKQCLNGRIGTEEKMIAELQAWENKRNQEKKMIEWKFTKQDADSKLSKYYI
jgi:hypothetical protein